MKELTLCPNGRRCEQWSAYMKIDWLDVSRVSGRCLCCAGDARARRSAADEAGGARRARMAGPRAQPALAPLLSPPPGAAAANMRKEIKFLVPSEGDASKDLTLCDAGNLSKATRITTVEIVFNFVTVVLEISAQTNTTTDARRGLPFCMLRRKCIGGCAIYKLQRLRPPYAKLDCNKQASTSENGVHHIVHHTAGNPFSEAMCESKSEVEAFGAIAEIVVTVQLYQL
ncbi:hypothetical protein EVAR_32995_1 [Eumeta japonica]|uniref:Uncharacterized protein n=1 Tax=Eumeta variegata TaxID=151549 RepID=A0A4C1VSU1_EUMVA|nr:hypothetical protein EVAR_32995_1 [Eumeta japonica]